MRRIAFATLVSILCVWGLVGCGGIRYSQVDADAKNFHPKRVGVLPVDVGSYEEARGVVDLSIAGVLAEKKWFEDVVAGDTMKNLLLSNEEFRKTVLDYTVKVKTVNFSDPVLSKKIGNIAKIDAFLLVNVDYWLYTKESDNKVGKVGLGIKMIETASGKMMWKAGHHLDESYTLFKPALPDVAHKLVRQLVNEMPH
jgi:hypothetical protein